MNHTLTALLATTLLTATAYAQDDAGDRRGKDRRGPPPEAVEACSTQVRGDPCSFQDPRGNDLEGTCEAPEDKPLACRPEGGKPHGHLHGDTESGALR